MRPILVNQSSCPFTNWDSRQFRQAFFWNSCIKHNGILLTWEQAKTACNEYDGGHLLILDSKEQESEFNQTLEEVMK